MKNTQNIGFADLAKQGRKIKEDFFNQINLIIDWKAIEKVLSKYYKKGLYATADHRSFSATHEPRLIQKIIPLASQSFGKIKNGLSKHPLWKKRRITNYVD